MAEQSHSYYEWQVSTLMLAYDVIEPISRHDEKRLAERNNAVEQEIHEMAHRVIPQAYRDNPQMEFPPAIIVLLTKATLARAARIIGLTPEAA
ncbi:MAG TPA: hypothetical protein VGB55_05280 [Tepidisphaeraceae bacterium]|jgi:hypothetical protein